MVTSSPQKSLPVTELNHAEISASLLGSAHSKIKLSGHTMLGAGSSTVMVWLPIEVFPHTSVKIHVLVFI